MNNSSENLYDEFISDSLSGEEDMCNGTNASAFNVASLSRQNEKPAEMIKAELIDFLLSNGRYELIASEIPFFKGDRWADIIAIRKSVTLGFEIKSERDSINKLTEQLADYVKVFNVVYLVLAERFKKKYEIKKIPKKIGIIMIDHKGKLSIYRKAVSRVQLDKSSLLTLLWRKDLEMLAPAKRDAEIDCLRDYVAKHCTVKSIQNQVIFSLKERYSESFRVFLKDRGTHTVIEDLRTITKLKKLPVLSNVNIE